MSQELGFSLLELLVSLLVGAMAISIVLGLLKNAYRVSDDVKRSQENRLHVTEFVKRFHDDIASAGYRSFKYSPDKAAGSVCMPLCLPNEPMLPLTLQGELVNDLVAGTYDLQTITYQVRRLEPPRSAAHPVEYGVFKTKAVNRLEAYTDSDSNQLVLAGLPAQDSFECRRFLNPNNGSVTLLECVLRVYSSMQRDDIETFSIVAKLENF